MSLHKDKRVPFDISERWRAEDALRRLAERQAMLLEVTSDLIRASEPAELGRKTFEYVRSAFGAVVCTNYRLDPATRRLRLVFVHGIPPKYLEAAQSLELGQGYCGTAAASSQPLVADTRRITSDPNGGLVRELGATAYACYPLKASDGRLLGTFAVASATRESFTDDEVAWLGTITNFLAQAWERFEAEQSLRASEERLRLSQEAGGLGHWDYDYASDTLVWSDQTRTLLGVEPGEPPSRQLLRSRVHPEARPRLEEHIARSAHLDADHIRPFEFRVVMPNGVIRWLEDQDRVETSAAGLPVRAVGIVRDITARKAHEGHVQLLMRELDHRVKNMLSIVQAIARQTAAREPDDFVVRFIERIRALSVNQDLLVRNEWQGADVEELVRTQLAPFTDLVGSRIVVHGPKLRLNAAAAQAIGLTLHELATNAGKYGALSTDKGHVDVRWGTDGRTLTMSWTERDGPPVAPPERRGFGSMVIASMATEAVEGEVQLDYAPSGLVWRLSCPAANGLEAAGGGHI